MTKTPGTFGPEDFRRLTDVSRETLAVLEHYAARLAEWQKRINLVGPATLPELWWRHFYDSAQLFPLAPESARIWADLGSGAGFPGLVLALMLKGAGREATVHLVESDSRKAAFLATVARETGAPAMFHVKRIEDMAPWPCDVVTARALAPLPRLLDHAAPFLEGKKSGLCLFLKGQDHAGELTAASKCWRLEDYDVIPSQTDPRAAILAIRRFSRRNSEDRA